MPTGPPDPVQATMPRLVKGLPAPGTPKRNSTRFPGKSRRNGCTASPHSLTLSTRQRCCVRCGAGGQDVGGQQLKFTDAASAKAAALVPVSNADSIAIVSRFPSWKLARRGCPNTLVPESCSPKERAKSGIFGLAIATIVPAAADEPSSFSKLTARRNASTSFSSCCSSASFSRSKSLIFSS